MVLPVTSAMRLQVVDRISSAGSEQPGNLATTSGPLCCVACGGTDLRLLLLRGQDRERFLHLRCHTCREEGLVQCDELNDDQTEDLAACLDSRPDIRERLQEEWGQWLAWKRRYAYPRHWPTPPRRISSWWMVGILLLLLVWALSDVWQVAGVWREDVPARQAVVNEYVDRLKGIECLPEAMREKLRTVEIHYTLEPAVHGNLVQYGEAGVYWGEEQIRVHRSNFWLGTIPKRAILLETLVHEARHRVSPALGHNALFHQLVQQDLQCVLKHW